MIERLQRIANFLGPLRLLIFVMGGFSMVIVLLSLFENPWLTGDRLLIPSILGFCWAATLYSISKLFAVVPGMPNEGAGFRERLSIRLRRGGLWILAVLTIGLTIAVVVLSFELLRTWF